MRRALVAIGVNKTASSFPELKAAALGAKQVHAWAKRQGFDSVLLTDDAGKVRHADVYDAVDTFVQKGVYDQLVLYFSGHGVLMAPDCEAWLLSGAPDNQNEAINVAGSIANARTCGIEHIVVYSDACRSIPKQWRSALLTPGTVFRVMDARPPAPEVDAFYATLPGNPAFEVPPDEASQAYRGLLTDCLMKALDGQVSTVITNQAQRRVVPARPLKVYLAKAIPAAAANVSIKLNQTPDARVESALPKFLSEVAGDPGLDQRVNPPVELEAVRPTDLPLGLKRTVLQMQERVLVRPEWGAEGPANLAGIPDPEGVQSSMARLLQVTGRVSFETRTGFSIQGAGVASAKVTGTTCDVFDESGAQHVRVHENYNEVVRTRSFQPRTALIRFSDGSGVVLAALQGYVGSVVVEGGQVVTVNYTPSGNSRNFREYQHAIDHLEQRRAFVAVAARNGSFRLDRAGEAADYLRVLKRVDPTLGIYAAYAYAQVGNFEGVRSVFRYMSREEEPVPFDVAMLSLQDDPRAVLNFAPGLPMLTQGWMSLGRFEALMPKPLQEARRYLKPSLWTTFTNEGMDILEGALDGGV